jgi:hypothetical protein
MAAGGWLFLSGFIFEMTQAQRINVWVVGFAVVAIALAALRTDEHRFGNSALAFWLLVSTMTLFRTGGAALVNNLAVSLVVFGLSLIPNPGGRGRPHCAGAA